MNTTDISNRGHRGPNPGILAIITPTNGRQTAYECVRVVNSPTVIHYKYRRRQSRGTG